MIPCSQETSCNFQGLKNMFYYLPPLKFATMDLGPHGTCLDQALGFGTEISFKGWRWV